MKGLLDEDKEVMALNADPTLIDAALIAAQRVEHYEMASSGCVRTFARLLGYEHAAGLLQETLDQEGAADKKQTQLAESVIMVEVVVPVASDETWAGSTQEKRQTCMLCQRLPA
jgi:ferritin-like metal-binding protein YciE